MRLIAHRGNLTGPGSPRENTWSYLKEALDQGYDVEVDVWGIGNELILGHDRPCFRELMVREMSEYSDRLWVHCKNQRALELFFRYQSEDNEFNFFWQDHDAYSMTSMGFVWCNVGVSPPSTMGDIDYIQVLPERAEWNIDYLAKGVCSDYVEKIRPCIS